MSTKQKIIMTPEKRNIISQLIELYDVKDFADIQDALKDLLGGTVQGMLEAELDETLGYEKHELTEEPKTNYRNGHKPKTLKSKMGELEISVPQDKKIRVRAKDSA